MPPAASSSSARCAARIGASPPCWSTSSLAERQISRSLTGNSGLSLNGELNENSTLGWNNDQAEQPSRVVASVNTMVVAVFLGEDDRKPSATYRVIARSGYEAAKLISDYFGERNPWVRVDVTAVMSGGVEGPPRVIGPIGESGFDRQSTPKH